MSGNKHLAHHLLIRHRALQLLKALEEDLYTNTGFDDFIGLSNQVDPTS